jgi:hypothetical protein
MSGANCYMFRHQPAALRQFVNNKGPQVERTFQALVSQAAGRLCAGCRVCGRAA